MGYTREHFAELLDITPKFCSDIEFGVKGMSVPTRCKISMASAASSSPLRHCYTTPSKFSGEMELRPVYRPYSLEMEISS